MREDSFHGAPDLLDLGSHFEHRPTLTEAFEPDKPEVEAAIHCEDSPPWPCPSCQVLNASTTMTCWNCEAARPSLDAAAESPGETIRAPEDTVATLPDAVHVDAATTAHAADDPASLTMSDPTPHEAETVLSDPLAGMVRQQVSAPRRRRQAILAIGVSVALALALTAYFMYPQGIEASLSRTELRDIVANRAKTPAPPAPGLDSLRRAAGSISPASSAESSAQPPSTEPASRALAIDAAAAKAAKDGIDTRGRVADEVSGAAAAAEHVLPLTPAPATAQTPPCSASAFALGLCDADSSSTRRQ